MHPMVATLHNACLIYAITSRGLSSTIFTIGLLSNWHICPTTFYVGTLNKLLCTANHTFWCVFVCVCVQNAFILSTSSRSVPRPATDGKLTFMRSILFLSISENVSACIWVASAKFRWNIYFMTTDGRKTCVAVCRRPSVFSVNITLRWKSIYAYV